MVSNRSWGFSINITESSKIVSFLSSSYLRQNILTIFKANSAKTWLGYGYKFHLQPQCYGVLCTCMECNVCNVYVHVCNVMYACTGMSCVYVHVYQVTSYGVFYLQKRGSCDYLTDLSKCCNLGIDVSVIHCVKCFRKMLQNFLWLNENQTGKLGRDSRFEVPISQTSFCQAALRLQIYQHCLKT